MSYFTCIIQFFFPLHFLQAKAKEEKVKKCGEDEETVPSEYRLKPATVRRSPHCVPAARCSCSCVPWHPVCPQEASGHVWPSSDNNSGNPETFIFCPEQLDPLKEGFLSSDRVWSLKFPQIQVFQLLTILDIDP